MSTTSNRQRLRALIYVRLSSYRGADDPSTSPERQREACKSYADAQGWEVVEVIEDLDVSGSRRGERLDRPGLCRIRERWSTTDVVIFLKIDRLARSVADFHAFAEEAQEHGAALVSVRDGLDLTTPSGRFVATILAAFAELEAETIADRTRDGRRAARAAGRWVGGPIPFGFRSAPNPAGPGRVLEVEDAEARVLHEVVERMAGGATLVEVTRWMNRHTDARPRRAREFTRPGVLSILTNESTSTLIFSAAERRTIRSVISPVVPAGPQGRKPSRMLSGLLICEGCGRPLTVTVQSTGIVGYRCYSHNRGARCDSPTFCGAVPVETWVEAAWLDAWGSVPETRAVRLADEADEILAGLDERIVETQAELAAAPRLARAALLADLEQLEDQREELLARPSSSLSVLRETGFTLGEVWEMGDVHDRRELFRRTVGTLTLRRASRRGPKSFEPERLPDRWRIAAT